MIVLSSDRSSLDGDFVEGSPPTASYLSMLGLLNSLQLSTGGGTNARNWPQKSAVVRRRLRPPRPWHLPAIRRWRGSSLGGRTRNRYRTADGPGQACQWPGATPPKGSAR